MKINFWMIILWVSLFMTSFAGAEELIGRVNESPPGYFQQDGKWVGFYVDAFQALCKEADVPITLQQFPWSRALDMMKTKPVLMSGLTPTEERKQFMHFIGPHAVEEMVVVMQKKYLNVPINSLDDLANLSKIIGEKFYYEQDAYYSKEFNERIEKDETFKQFFQKSATYTNTLDMVQAQRIPGYLVEKILVFNQLRTREKPKDNIGIHSFIISSTDIYFGVSKTVSSETIAKLQKANETLLKNGTYKKIAEKWGQ